MRRYYKADLDSGSYDPVQNRRECTAEEANLIGSRSQDDPEIHLPVFDIDYSAQLLPSSTEGHYHLYLNKPVTWEAYVKVLEALRDAGLIEKGFCDLSIQRGAAFVRPPWVRK